MMLKRIIFAGIMFPYVLLAGKPVGSSNEIGIFVGGSYYLGDLNPNSHFLLTQPAAGLMFRHYMNPRWGYRINAMFGQLEGDDSQSDSYSQQQRNLSFSSQVLELSAIVEFNFYSFDMGSGSARSRNSKYEEHPFSPYVFAGIGCFNYNPYVRVKSTKFLLQQLGTEGQGTSANPEEKYSLYQISIPFGVGIKMALTQKIGLSIEWGMRKTFTDFIDDVSGTYVDPVLLTAAYGPASAMLADRSQYPSVSGVVPVVDNTGRQRGNPRTHDWYNFTGIMLSFRLGQPDQPCPSYRGNKIEH